MHGASAESLASLTEALRASVDGDAEASRVADDLFAVSGVLRSEPSLRRVLTDVSQAADAKSGLVREMFGEKLAPASLELAAKAAELRWRASRDLGDALEQLGVVAVVRSADQAGESARLEDELFGFGRLVSENPGLRDALADSARSDEDKRALLRGLLDGNAAAATIRLAEQTVAGSHRTVAVAIHEYQKVAAEAHSQHVATIRVAREMADADQQRLSEALERQYGRKVHLNVLVDPDVVGGIRVEIGDDVIDGTVASRLDDARRRLAG